MVVQRETKLTPVGNNTLVRHPDEYPKGLWQKITILTLQAGQPRPYADSVYEYEITFEGGSPSSQEGWDLPMATFPPYNEPELGPGSTISRFPPSTREEREAAHTKRIKDRIKAIISHPWQAEDNDRAMGQSWLEEFECIEQEPTHTTYLVVVIGPYMD